MVFAGLSTGAQLRLGLALMVIGLVALPVAVTTSVLWLFFAGGIAAGAGLNIRASVATAAALAEPPSRGEVLAALFLAAYAGLVLPIPLVWLPSSWALLGFSVLELGLLAGSHTGSLWQRVLDGARVAGPGSGVWTD